MLGSNGDWDFAFKAFTHIGVPRVEAVIIAQPVGVRCPGVGILFVLFQCHVGTIVGPSMHRS